MGQRTRREIVFILLVILLLQFTKGQKEPTGATLTKGASSRGTDPDVLTQDAQAGNVTALNIDQTRVTDIWQGFYGNVSGSIVLENGAGDAFYDWTIAELTGEVFATRSVVNDWTNINCSNSTHWEREEQVLNIPSTAVDGINETYHDTGHPNFQVGNKILANCPSTRPYNSTGLAGQFWNVMLNSNSTNTVYAAVLSDNADSFDGGTADFEILVPTDRQTGAATYYFYAELS